jgi:hypothetical protein
MKRISYLKTGIWAESTARPSRLHRARAGYAAQPVGAAAQWIRRRAPRSGSKPDPIEPDPTR